MYLGQALNVLENIDWENVGANGSAIDINLAYEFLRRMSGFCNEHNIAVKLPFMVNIAEYLGCKEGISENILSRCSEKLYDFITNPTFSKAVVGFYLQLSDMADSNKSVSKYLNIYCPLIRLFERGGDFVYRERGMSLINAGMIPLLNWCENFKCKPSIDISML